MRHIAACRCPAANIGMRPIAVVHGPIRNDCNVQKAEVQGGWQKAAQQRSRSDANPSSIRLMVRPSSCAAVSRGRRLEIPVLAAGRSISDRSMQSGSVPGSPASVLQGNQGRPLGLLTPSLAHPRALSSGNEEFSWLCFNPVYEGLKFTVCQQSNDS